MLRAALLRHLGIDQKCAINADYHGVKSGQTAELIIDPDGPSGEPEPYDYEKASDLFEKPESKKKGGHTFNVVVYQNKYRIMDYLYFGYYFDSSTEWESHQMDNVWNDHFGTWWYGPFTSPALKIHNYPGEVKCYEEGKDYWTHRTLYEDICP